jgi:hypothetical protein
MLEHFCKIEENIFVSKRPKELIVLDIFTTLALQVTIVGLAPGLIRRYQMIAVRQQRFAIETGTCNSEPTNQICHHFNGFAHSLLCL